MRNGNLSEFPLNKLKKFICQNPENLKLIGSLSNAETLTELAKADCNPVEDRVITLLNPVFFKTHSSSEETLFDMSRLSKIRQLINMSHRLDFYDVYSYGISSDLQNFKKYQGEARFWDDVRTFHPIYTACSFVNKFCDKSVMKLIADVYDIRWFINPRRPNRLNKFFNYLGLTPINFRYLDGDQVVPSVNLHRAKTFLQIWYNPESLEDVRRGNVLEETKLFLWSNRVDHLWKLKASKQLATLVFWFAYFVRAQQTTRELQFDPLKFFKEAQTAESFKVHYSNAVQNRRNSLYGS